MKPCRILVIDEQPQIARLTRMVLQHVGKHEVSVETRPAQALAAARQFAPHAIVLDFKMPGKNGIEVAREIWSDNSLGEIAILFFCGLIPGQVAAVQEIARGPFRFLSKLSPPADLLTAVAEMLLLSRPSASA